MVKFMLAQLNKIFNTLSQGRHTGRQTDSRSALRIVSKIRETSHQQHSILCALIELFIILNFNFLILSFLVFILSTYR